jgi:stage III sporulation protein SpoIIIAA|tara:strand:- start:17183 stop:18868 length:1686 start_codon:yes stop_codon:yes gene_type:complete
MLLADDLNQLLDILPEFISLNLENHPKRGQLIEIVLDIGRRPEARFSNGNEYLSYRTIIWQDLDFILKRLGKFSGDNRAGIEKTLHRISSLRNRQGSIIGLTCRIGRAIFGTVSIVRDLLEKGQSILILGKPGVGKTTAIREIARVLSDGMNKRVIIIDTSNEIAGDGDLPHPSIGKARRMQVSSPQNQHNVMVEAVENHMPEIIIIDEIGTELEAAAARTIAERGVQLVGTAHGNALENLIKNPTITDLIGGIQYVTLGDEEAKRRGSSKSILERKAPPTFEIAIEIHDPKTWIIHENIENSVDLLLQGKTPLLQQRKLEENFNNVIHCDIQKNEKDFLAAQENTSKKVTPEKKTKSSFLLNNFKNFEYLKSKRAFRSHLQKKEFSNDGFIYIYIYGINNQDVKSLIKTLRLPLIITKELQYADVVIALGNLVKNNKKLRQISHSKKISIHIVESNSLLQIAKALRQIVKKTTTSILPNVKALENGKKIKRIIEKEFLTPLEETRLAIEEIVIPQQCTIDLLPRNKPIRKLQHELISHYQLKGVSVGIEPNRRLRIYSKF